MNLIKEQVADWIVSLVDDGILEINSAGEIEYTQKWLNEQLFEDWCLECGYGTTELMYIIECFENYRAEKEIEVKGEIVYEAYDEEYDEIYREYEEEIEIIQVTTKK